MSGRRVISLAAIVSGAIVGAIIFGVTSPSYLWAIAAAVGAVMGALGGVVFAILLRVILWVPSLWREHRRIALAAGGVAVIAAVLATTLVVWDRTLRPSSLEAVVINLDVSCIAPCPTYELSIRGNGTVTYVGHDNVAVRGRQTALISQAKVARLVEAFYESGFFTMPHSSCGFPDLSCWNGPHSKTTISFDGFIREVRAIGGRRNELDRLQDKIAAVAVANGWLKQAR